MKSGTTAAELFGGVGLFLLGTRLCASGFGVTAGARLRQHFAEWTADAPRAFATGVALSAMVPGSGSLPASALGLARNGQLGTHRAVRLVVGCSFGLIFAALLALIDRTGWLPQAAGLAALGLGALFAELSPRRAAVGELAAGWGLVLLGVHLFGSGWASIAEHGHLRSSLAASFGLGIGGAALALGLRSPAAVVALAVQAAAMGAIDGSLGAAAILGACATIPCGSWRAARGGSEHDRTVAALHLLHGALATLLGLGLLLWSADMPVLFQRAPGLVLLTFSLLICLLPVGLLWPFIGGLEHFLLARFESTGSKGTPGLASTLGAQTVPALAVERLALSVEDSAESTRVLARKVLNGTGVSQYRRDELLGAVTRVEEEVRSFRRALDGVRWPGASVARVLHAERAARGYRAICERLIELGGLEGTDPAGPLSVPFLQARQRVLRLLEQEPDAEAVELQHGEIAAQLEELRIAALYAFASGALEVGDFDACSRRLEELRGLAQRIADAAEARSRLVVHAAALPEEPEEAQELEAEEEPEEHAAQAEYALLEEEGEDVYRLEEQPSLLAPGRRRAAPARGRRQLG